MVTDEEILNLFRSELPIVGTLTGKMIPLQIDDALQWYAYFDDLCLVMDRYAEKYHVDIDGINFDAYYPWADEWFFRKWFTKKPVVQTSEPLTVRMFAESARAGRWLYD